MPKRGKEDEQNVPIGAGMIGGEGMQTVAYENGRVVEIASVDERIVTIPDTSRLEVTLEDNQKDSKKE